MRAKSVVPVLGSLVAAAGLPGQWKSLQGEQVPEIAVAGWLNTGDAKPTIADLKGKVWLLEFFATW